MQTTKRVVYAAIIGALYFVMVIALAPISFHILQFRAANVLKALAVCRPEFALGFALGNFFANQASPFGWLDWGVMPVFDIVGALTAYALRQLQTRGFPWLAVLAQSTIIAVGVATFPLGLGAGLPWLLSFVSVLLSSFSSLVLGQQFSCQHIRQFSTMMILLPGNVNAFRKAVQDRPDMWGWLITPRRSMSRSQGLLKRARWAADNECYTLGDQFDSVKYTRFLKRSANRWADSCLFATAPDVVANAQATMHNFKAWSHSIRQIGLPVALVAQDGLEDLHTPWDILDALFIGGSTDWKLGQHARDLIAEAKSREKWVHVGRVNSAIRLRYCIKLGVDSIDGTEWAINPGRGITWATKVMLTMHHQPALF